MALAREDNIVYSATYSNVGVYELVINTKQVMRRRSDDWINATHILIVADLDKPARTRVLEKEVQLGTHEKIQGGYGKYQGTWVPLEQGMVVAQKYNVYDILKPIFEFVPGPESPPRAPKRTNAASKPRQPKVAGAPRKNQPKATPAQKKQPKVEINDNISEQLHDDDSPDEHTIGSPSMIDEDDYPGTGRRRRQIMLDEQEMQNQDHDEWSNALLDYFILRADDDPISAAHNRPRMPANVQIDRPVDGDGHTALHWACSMGDIDTAKELLQHNASIHARNLRGETPLIRAGLFANCYDRGTWPKMVYLLHDTITTTDFHGGTVFHHVALTATGGSKAARAKHYLEVLLSKLMDMVAPTEFVGFLNVQDKNGDTAFHISARLSRRCSRLFTAYGLPSDIPNNKGETVSSITGWKVKSRSQSLGGHHLLPLSSSPTTDRTPHHHNNTNTTNNHNNHHHLNNTTNPSSPSKFSTTLGISLSHLHSAPSQHFSRSLNTLITSHANSFLSLGESEITQKTALLADLARATERTAKQASTTRHKIYTLTAQLEQQSPPHNSTSTPPSSIPATTAEIPDLDTALSLSSQQLTHEAHLLEEQLQHRQLQRLVHQEENTTHTLSGLAQPDAQLELDARELACYALVREQEARVRFVRELVAAEANSGMSMGGQHLVGLVGRILGIGSEEVLGVVDEILEDMEAGDDGEGEDGVGNGEGEGVDGVMDVD